MIDFFQSDLCHRQWGEASVYQKQRRRSWMSSKRLYLLLDEGTLTFNSDPNKVKNTVKNKVLREILENWNWIKIQTVCSSHLAKRCATTLRTYDTSCLSQSFSKRHFCLRLRTLSEHFYPTENRTTKKTRHLLIKALLSDRKCLSSDRVLFNFLTF